MEFKNTFPAMKDTFASNYDDLNVTGFLIGIIRNYFAFPWSQSEKAYPNKFKLSFNGRFELALSIVKHILRI